MKINANRQWLRWEFVMVFFLESLRRLKLRVKSSLIRSTRWMWQELPFRNGGNARTTTIFNPPPQLGLKNQSSWVWKMLHRWFAEERYQFISHSSCTFICFRPIEGATDGYAQNEQTPSIFPASDTGILTHQRSYYYSHCHGSFSLVLMLLLLFVAAIGVLNTFATPTSIKRDTK